MKKIANIVSSVELFNHKHLDWINYVPLTVHCNLGIPTLIIGWNNYKREFPHLFPNIIEKKSNSNHPLWWEFSIEEKITDHFSGIENFIKQAPKEYVNLYQYECIDPITHKIESEYEIFLKFPMNNSKFYQYKDEIIYILNETKIYGIYLNSYRYFKFDCKKITNEINQNIDGNLDLDGSIYQSYYKQFPDFDLLKRSMVLFLN